MKKLVKILAGAFALGMFFSCSSEPGNDGPSIPAPGPDSIRLWTNGSAQTEWKIYDRWDLEKLSEIVNSGVDFANTTFTVMNDITINSKVLVEDESGSLAEPAESSDGNPASGLVNLDSIGMRTKAFKGTFDGNGKVISGYYSYQGHQGLGFIGCAGNGAVIKNVILKDACVINKNTDASDPKHDGTDDDRFGGVLGLIEDGGTITIENCVYVGVVGSAAAYGRNSTYEYIGGLIGRNEKSIINAINCTVYAKYYGSGDYVCGKQNGTLNKLLVTGADLDDFDDVAEDALEAKIAEIKEIVAGEKDPYVMPTVNPPVIGTPSAIFSEPTAVEITAEQGTIYWQFIETETEDPKILDATNYTTVGTVYEGAVTVSKAGKLYALAVVDTIASKVVSAQYGFSAEPPVTQHTVTFVNGLTSNEVKVNDGEKVAKPADPTEEGKIFLGWFAPEAVEAFDFENTTITADLTLTAGWEDEPAVPVEHDVTIAPTENGTVTPSVTAAVKDTVVTLTIVYDEENYVVGTVTVMAGDVAVDVDTNDGYSFVMPDSDVVVTVTFNPVDNGGDNGNGDNGDSGDSGEGQD